MTSLYSSVHSVASRFAASMSSWPSHSVNPLVAVNKLTFEALGVDLVEYGNVVKVYERLYQLVKDSREGIDDG